MQDNSVLSPLEIKQFLLLQQKSEDELRAICEGMGLSTKGRHSDLFERLSKLKLQPKVDILRPQAIPLYSRKNNKLLEGAIETFKRWREALFAQHNFKQFILVNSKGKEYSTKMRYLPCRGADVTFMLDNNYLSDRADYKEIIHLLGTPERDQFELNLVNKQDVRGNNWLMLHVAPRKAA